MSNGDQLLRALGAIDRLNRWVRVRSVSRPRKAVYWLKSRYAIRDAVMAGLVPRMRYVAATVKCTRCREGKFYDWDGQFRGSCYHCGGKGLVRLKFVETTIADRWVWHTPLEYSTWHGWPMDDLEPEEVTLDWQPGRDGEDLPVEAAARLLNIVEAHWPIWKGDRYNKLGPYEHSRDEYDSTRYYLFNYGFDLPRDEKLGPCALCGGECSALAHFCGVTIAPGFSMSRRVCERCGARREVFDELKLLPEPEILKHPDVAKWRAVHLTVFDELWKMRRKIWEVAS